MPSNEKSTFNREYFTEQIDAVVGTYSSQMDRRTKFAKLVAEMADLDSPPSYKTIQNHETGKFVPSADMAGNYAKT